MDLREASGTPGRGQYPVDGRDDRELRGSEDGRSARRGAEIREADIDPIETFGRQNRVELPERPCGLDNGEGQHNFVGMRGVLLTGVERRPDRPMLLFPNGGRRQARTKAAT